MIFGFSVIFYFVASRLFAITIFKHISHFNIRKSEQAISETKRELKDLTLKDVQLFLLAHMKSFIFTNLFLLPLTIIIYLALIYGTDVIGQAVETSSQINMQNPDREFNDLELISIFLPAVLSFPKYVIYSSMISFLLAAYLATKRMFGNKKIYKQFYLCRIAD
jgi:hypothetical protein